MFIFTSTCFTILHSIFNSKYENEFSFLCDVVGNNLAFVFWSNVIVCSYYVPWWIIEPELCVSIYIYIYAWIYVYRYITITDLYTTALLLTKPSSDDNSGFRHGFGAEASLPLTQSAPAVTHGTTRLCQIVVALLNWEIHAHAVRSLSWHLFHVFPLVWWKKSKIS